MSIDDINDIKVRRLLNAIDGGVNYAGLSRAAADYEIV
jgi:hypothetical protein